jgi:hypothetical protein
MNRCTLCQVSFLNYFVAPSGKVLKKDLNVLLQILEQSHQHQKHQKYEQPLKQLSYLLNVNDEEKSWKNSILLCCLFLY